MTSRMLRGEPSGENEEPSELGGPAPGKRALTDGLPVQRKVTSGIDTSVLPSATSSPGDGAGADPFAVHLLDDAGPGQMPGSVRTKMEASFGFDLSPVRIHQDGAADAMGARAFARGSDLHFGAGEYAPEQPEGLSLLAHELAHVTQQAMGRAPAAVRAKLGQLQADDPFEVEADDMAARAVRGEPAWSGAGGPLRTLPSLNGPIYPKLRVGLNWIKSAQLIADQVAANGGDAAIVAILQRWSRDNRKLGRVFRTWADAIDAARRGDADGPGGDEDDGGDGPDADDRPSRLRQLLTVFFIFMLLLAPALGLLFMNNRYEVRPGMNDTAMTARRPLEPLMEASNRARIMELAQHTVVQSLREETARLDLGPLLDEHPEIEAAVPAASELRRVGEHLETIAPHLEALEPALRQARPALEQLGPNDLDNPARAGVYHAHIFLQPPPDTSPAQGPGLPGAEGPEQSPAHPTDLGFFHDGVHPDRPDMMPAYGAPQHHYDRALMERAALEVAGNFGHYKGITHNCQDYVDAVVAHYKRLGGREVVPTTRSAVTLAVTDLIIEYATSLIDRQVDTAVGEELAALPPSEGASQCARAVSAHLGLSADTFAGAIDGLLAQRVPIQGRQVALREALCTPVGMASMDRALSSASAALDREVTLPEEGPSTVRDALCTPKGDSNPLKGLVFELARIKAIDKILEGMPGFIRDDELARNKFATHVTARLAENLYQRLNLKGLCG